MNVGQIVRADYARGHEKSMVSTTCGAGGYTISNGHVQRYRPSSRVFHYVLFHGDARGSTDRFHNVYKSPYSTERDLETARH